MPGDNVLRFKSPYDAYEHCRTATYAWHPQWQAALRANDIAELKNLEQEFRRRVLAVFPKDVYAGAWASTNANFAYRLSELSEFENAVEHMAEARSLYRAALPEAAPEWHSSLRATHEHCCAEVLLRYAEVSGERAVLSEAGLLCEQAAARNDGEKRRALVTLAAIHRRIAEHDSSLAACEAALHTLLQFDVEQTPETGDLSWALQRQTFAAVLLLQQKLGADTDLSAARIAIDKAFANYSLNPHDFWIRPSRLQDAIRTKTEIEQGNLP